MTAARPRPRHPSASVMLRRMDGELDPTLDRRLRRHLDRCAPCRGRMERLEETSTQASGALRAALAVTPVPELRRQAARRAMRAAGERRARGRNRRFGGLAVAASIAGVLVLSWTVGPLRAWVAELGMGGGGEEVAEPVVSLPGAVVGGAASIVAFDAASDLFTIELDARQLAGDLLLQVLPIERATAQITRSGSESMLVLPAGLRIENSTASVASYRVTLPPTVSRVEVRVGDAAPHVIPVGGDGWQEEVPVR